MISKWIGSIGQMFSIIHHCKVQINTTMRCHLTPIRVAVIKKTSNNYELGYRKGKILVHSVQFSSVAQSCPTLWPHELQHTRPPCPSPTPGVHSNSCPSSQWCHLAISSSVVPFSSCPQSLPATESFPMSQLFA